MTELTLYQIGLQFKYSVQAGNLLADQYGAILLDLCSDYEDLKPALLDLGKRKSFRELPLSGTPAQMILARDNLASELAALYLPEIVIDLIDLIEGALGFVDLPSDQFNAEGETEEFDQEEITNTADEEMISYEPRSEEIDDYNLQLESTRRLLRRRPSLVENEILQSYPEREESSKSSKLSSIGQIGRTLIYQIPPFSLFLMIKLISGAQANLDNPTGTLNPSSLALEYVYKWPWALMSFASITLCAAAFQSGRTEKEAYRVEVPLLAYYTLIMAIVYESKAPPDFAIFMVSSYALSSLSTRVLMGIISCLKA
ncbi:hypothetical protein KBY83_14355 [Cyanobium sp. WKJ7-Wakatipu]|uniref:hypothetical protein n=1 Tax=Cyanobium sp. WKJ7-Wakatipu TaxID=2823726 RepID=UPI0020CC0409|nr:hypothetical protein [Cyanobium sp. WKJ7-Wakatipu]MCP9784476.1 hypothetical protein [Cyanobium sp. WKJ7-Wakatipu]